MDLYHDPRSFAAFSSQQINFLGLKFPSLSLEQSVLWYSSECTLIRYAPNPIFYLLHGYSCFFKLLFIPREFLVIGKQGSVFSRILFNCLSADSIPIPFWFRPILTDSSRFRLIPILNHRLCLGIGWFISELLELADSSNHEQIFWDILRDGRYKLMILAVGKLCSLILLVFTEVLVLLDIHCYPITISLSFDKLVW